MTPAITSLEQQCIDFTLHTYSLGGSHHGYGLEAAEKLGVPASRVFKTLVVQLNSTELAVGIVPVDHELHLKLIAAALDAKKAVMADPQKVERTTGYVLGGVSPLGQKRALRSVIDSSAQDYESVFVSGGKRGLEIELAPEDLRIAIQAQYSAIIS